jgi:hypothetical protein
LNLKSQSFTMVCCLDARINKFYKFGAIKLNFKFKNKISFIQCITKIPLTLLKVH